MASTTVTVRMDSETKEQLQDVLSEFGMDMTTFFVMSAKQVIRDRELHFALGRVVGSALTPLQGSWDGVLEDDFADPNG